MRRTTRSRNAIVLHSTDVDITIAFCGWDQQVLDNTFPELKTHLLGKNNPVKYRFSVVAHDETYASQVRRGVDLFITVLGSTATDQDRNEALSLCLAAKTQKTLTVMMMEEATRDEANQLDTSGSPRAYDCLLRLPELEVSSSLGLDLGKGFGATRKFRAKHTKHTFAPNQKLIWGLQAVLSIVTKQAKPKLDLTYLRTVLGHGGYGTITVGRGRGEPSGISSPYGRGGLALHDALEKVKDPVMVTTLLLTMISRDRSTRIEDCLEVVEEVKNVISANCLLIPCTVLNPYIVSEIVVTLVAINDGSNEIVSPFPGLETSLPFTELYGIPAFLRKLPD